MKTKLKQFAALFLSVLLVLAMVFSVAACNGGGNGPDDSGNNGPTEQDPPDDTGDKKDSFTVTFHYGFDAGDFDAATGTVKKYKSELKRETKGKKVTLASAALKLFEVEGFEVSGYSTTDWQKDGIAADMDVNVLYTPLETVNVTFKNADGSVIKTATGYKGRALALSEYPDTENPVFIISSERFNKMTAAEQSDYTDYEVAGSTLTGYKMLKADAARINSAAVVPVGKYFKSWEGMQTAPTADCTVTASLGDGNAVMPKTAAITVDGVKDAAYEKVDSLVHVVVYSSVTNDKMKDYTNDDAGWKKAATRQGGTNAADAKIYAAYDGDWLYFYFEIADERVLNLGKKFNEQIANPWQQDGIEFYYAFGTATCRLQVDALGYHIDAGDYTNSSAYQDKVKYATSLTGVDIASVKKGEGMIDATGATGYNIEIAIPAYKEPEKGVTPSDTIGGAGWGEKVGIGDMMYFALQLNNIDALPVQKAYDQAISENAANLYAYMSSVEIASFNAVAFGSQFHDFVDIGYAKRYVLG